MSARETLIGELRRHALVIGEVTLTSGAVAQYYVDAKRAILQPAGFSALAELVASFARQWEATAVGGLTMGADAPACAALAGGARVKAFFVREETKQHGLPGRGEGPPLEGGGGRPARQRGPRLGVAGGVGPGAGVSRRVDGGRARRGPRRVRRDRHPRP